MSNLLSTESKILIRGLILDLSEVQFTDIDKARAGGMFTGWKDMTTAVVTASNKYYDPDTWAYTQQGDANIRIGYTALPAHVINIPGDVTFTAGDVNGSYVYLRSVNADFSPLQDTNKANTWLLFDGFYFTDWYYVSPALS